MTYFQMYNVLFSSGNLLKNLYALSSSTVEQNSLLKCYIYLILQYRKYRTCLSSLWRQPMFSWAFSLLLFSEMKPYKHSFFQLMKLTSFKHTLHPWLRTYIYYRNSSETLKKLKRKKTVENISMFLSSRFWMPQVKPSCRM